MKKSSLTPKRSIGIYGLGLLVFLAIFCSQEVLANVILNVNAKSSTSGANKIYYKSTTTTTNTPTTVTLPWKEKAVYGNVGEVAVTVNNKVIGDLVVKLDIATYTSGSAISVVSYYLKYVAGTFGDTIGLKKDLDVLAEDITPLNCTNLKTLYLRKNVPAASTINLFDFFTDETFTPLLFPAQVTLTAVLLDDIDAVAPQVLGVDIQSIYFNYIPTTGTDWSTLEPLWLYMLRSAAP